MRWRRGFSREGVSPDGGAETGATVVAKVLPPCSCATRRREGNVPSRLRDGLLAGDRLANGGRGRLQGRIGCFLTGEVVGEGGARRRPYEVVHLGDVREGLGVGESFLVLLQLGVAGHRLQRRLVRRN